MISLIPFINLFMLAFARRQIARSWGSPAWHLETKQNENNLGRHMYGMLPPPEFMPTVVVPWYDSQTLSQWQEDAAASMAHSYPKHVQYSPHYSQNQPQMSSSGHAGMSYDPPFNSVRNGYMETPMYTTILKHLNDAIAVLTQQVIPDSDGNLSDHQIQYIMVLTAISDLMDDTINMGSESYASRYKTVVQDAIAKVEKNPLPSALSINTRITTVSKQLAGIINFIKEKQKECTEPISDECDVIIDEGLAHSKNVELQGRASFLIALADSMRMFINDYLYQITQVSNSNGAVNYLLNAADNLKPLVMAGADARKRGLQVKLLPLLRTNNNNNNNNRLDRNNNNNNNRLDSNNNNNRLDRHLNRLENAVNYLRNRNHRNH